MSFGGGLAVMECLIFWKVGARWWWLFAEEHRKAGNLRRYCSWGRRSYQIWLLSEEDRQKAQLTLTISFFSSSNPC